MASDTLSCRWLDPPPLPFAGAASLVSSFLCERTIDDWQTFTLTDVENALDDLLQYQVFEHLDYDEDNGPPNRDNVWHQVLHSYELTEALRTTPAFYPEDVPFY